MVHWMNNRFINPMQLCISYEKFEGLHIATLVLTVVGRHAVRQISGEVQNFRSWL